LVLRTRSAKSLGGRGISGYSSDMRLKDRVAIVTGASRGIGKACALALAKEGAAVVLASKSLDESDPRLPGTLRDVEKEITALGGRALAVKCDVRFVGEIEEMVKQAGETFGRIDILLNNAGAFWWHPMEETPEKRFDLVLTVNTKGPFFAAKACLPWMKKNRWGHIVNMSPPVKVEQAENKIAYMISKFGMTLISHGLAAEVAQHNIAVNSLWPVTIIESYASINAGLGGPEMWRKADILADATIALVTQDPSKRSGQALLDEDVLRGVGVTDFSKYACVPGTQPPAIPW
jgi:citronellol/citronellal dehydrogenase